MDIPDERDPDFEADHGWRGEVVEVGAGYPDLVGVHPLDETYLAADRHLIEPPFVAVKAKGHTESGSVDIEKALQQAYSYL